MKTSRIVLLGLCAMAVTAIGGHLQAKPVSYAIPDDTAQFKPGPNLDTVQANCSGCHSADYIKTQPEGPKFKKDFWTAEVNKMIKVYGAPIDQGDVSKIVDYLTASY